MQEIVFVDTKAVIIMRIVVFSDSHDNIFNAVEVVERHKDVKTFVFLGDGSDDFETLKEMYPHKEFFGVRGNCDYFSRLPDEYMMDVDGIKILCTHGHLYNVEFSTDRLIASARSKGATIVLHGHTHKSYSKYDDGLYVVCPGSVSKPADRERTYAIIDILNNGISCNIVEIKR